MKKIFFVLAWSLLTISSLSGALYVLSIRYTASSELAYVGPSTNQSQPLTPNYLTGEVKGLHTQVEVADARVEIVRSFLERHKSPLQPATHFSQVFVDLADTYQIDYRLLPAIAMQESNLCKKIPEGSYNCLGFGVHSRGTLGFSTYEEGFDRAARELKKNYIDKGLTTPQQIMRKYTPSSNGSWADSVNQWISEMEYNSREAGIKLDSDADLTEYVASPTNM